MSDNKSPFLSENQDNNSANTSPNPSTNNISNESSPSPQSTGTNTSVFSQASNTTTVSPPISSPVSSASTSPSTTNETVKKSPFTQSITPPTPSPTKKHNKISVFVILATLIIVAILMIIFLVFVLSMGTPASNPVLKAFGIDPFALKITLIQITSLAFGAITFILFLLLTFGIFRGLMTKKEEKDKKKKSFVLAFFSFGMMFLTVIAWLGVYYYIEAFIVSAQMPEAEIIIKESPSEILEMESPIELNLSAEQVKKVADYNNRKITGFEWDLDNNGIFEFATQKITFVQRFNLSGKITIRLKVYYSDKETQVIEKTVVLPQAIFDYKPKNGPAPLTVTFDASKFNTTDNQIAKYEWDFDEDDYFEEVTDKAIITHIFTKIGTYKIKLKTETTTGSLDNYEAQINVETSFEEIQPFKAVIDSDSEIEELIAPVKLRFSAKESVIPEGELVSYKWNFGDSSLPTDTVITDHLFTKPGEYEIILTLTDQKGKTTEATKKIIVSMAKSAPKAIIKSFPKDLNGTVPFSVEFDASSSSDVDNNIVEYAWDFDNDEIIDSQNVKTNYVFHEAGTYTVVLTVIDADNQKDTINTEVKVVKNDIQAIIQATPQSGPVPLNVNFDGSTSSYAEGKIISYEWDFGDKSKPVLGGALNTHRYDEIGEYQVTLKVFADNGTTSSTTTKIYARTNPIQACFTVSRHSGTAPLAINFDSACSTGNITSWKWNFGDKSISKDRKPSHTFSSPGEYEVSLEIVDNTKNVSIYKDTITAQ